MKKMQFILMFALSILGCVILPASANAKAWIVDDGLMELTPEYTVQHIEGQPYSDVYAAFSFVPSKQLVKLRPGGVIAVNGQALEAEERADGYFYKGKVAVSEGGFTFTLTRSPGQAVTHSFELPQLGVKMLPQAYSPYAVLRVPVQYVEPPAYVVERYDLSINGPSLRFDLVSTKRKKDNRYQFDRLPDIQDGAVVFRHIIERAPPPGIYFAELYRQHRVVLSEMSGASRTGWATLTNTARFKIEVK